MKFLARVNPRYFAAITLFMAHSDVRYYLNGISIEPHPDGGVLLVATDGHRLGVLHDPDGWCESQFIVGSISKQLLAACKAKAKKADLQSAPAALWIGETGSMVCALPFAERGETAVHEEPIDSFGPLVLFTCKTSVIDGRFPDWRRVANQKRTAVQELFPAINSSYIYDVSLAQNIITGTSKYGYRGVNMEHTGRNGSVIIRVDDAELYDRFFVIVMAMRAEFPDTLFPKFMPQDPAPEFKSTLNDGRPPAVVARERGWTAGTRLIGDEGHGPDIIEITAVGEANLLVKCVSHNGTPAAKPRETSWTLSCRDWKLHL